MKYITRLLDTIDKEAFVKDYYDYSLTTSEVATRHGIKHTNYVAKVAKGFGLKTRNEMGARVRRKIDIDYGNQTRIYGLTGCNFTCEKWEYCNEHNPTTLPCELQSFDDEMIEYDEDSTVFYVCPVVADNLKIVY